MRSLAASALVAAALLAAGCGGSDEETAETVPPAATETEPATTTEPGPIGTTPVGVYFLRNDELGFAERKVALTPMIATAALEELLAGPTGDDADAGLASDVPSGTRLERLAIDGGTAVVELSNPLDGPATAQVVYTLTRFPTVKRVEIEGKTLTREDVEEHAPPILVESPTPGATVTSPLQATGSANTFEATFQAELVAGGETLAERFVTATSGSGTRGTFEFELPFTVASAQPGTLLVYELSAADGSRTNEVEIPLQLSP